MTDLQERLNGDIALLVLARSRISDGNKKARKDALENIDRARKDLNALWADLVAAVVSGADPDDPIAAMQWLVSR